MAAPATFNTSGQAEKKAMLVSARAETTRILLGSGRTCFRLQCRSPDAQSSIARSLPTLLRYDVGVGSKPCQGCVGRFEPMNVCERAPP